MEIEAEGEIACVLCACRTDGTYDIYCETFYDGVTFCSYIYKIAHLTLENFACSKYACSSCVQLVNVTERAELEYQKHRNVLLDIISCNPALVNQTVHTRRPALPHTVCVEYGKAGSCNRGHTSSEDDKPLASMKEPRVTQKNMKAIDDRDCLSDKFSWKNEIAEESYIRKEKNIKKTKRSKHKQYTKDRNPKRKQIQKCEVKIVKDTPDISYNGKVNADLKCNKCNRVFKKKCFYDRHSHCKKPYICEICGKSFRSPKHCNAHVLMHQGIADYKCIPCDKLFPTKVAFLRHDKIHNGVPCNQCDQCGKSFIHQSSLRMHKLAHSGVRKHTCDICGLALLSNSMLIRHKLVHTGEKKYACDLCGKKFARNSNMHTHMKTHAKNKPRPPTPPDVPGKRKKSFRCDMCPERFDRLYKLEIHLCDDHKVVLKKGRPKPRNTMKKLQRVHCATSNVFNVTTSPIESKNVLLHTYYSR